MDLGKNRLRATLLGSTLSLTALGLSPAWAQTAPADATPPAAKSPADATTSDGLHFDGIVVTGASSARKMLKVPYAITVLSAAQIADKGPTSTADALKGTPGLWVESTAGAAGSENVYARGLPGGSYEYFGLQEDGLPIYETEYETYVNADIFERVDLGTQRVEAVRGGTAPLFMNNAPGGVANFITNHGTATEEGAFKFTTGPNGLLRADITQSGPVAENLLMSFSGFGRVDNGLRNPGFDNGDNGGQFKIGATYVLPKGKLWADLKYINDHGVFYSDLPLTNPVTGQSLSNVINPHDGDLESASMEHVTLRTLTVGGGNTTFSRDLKDGIHPDVVTFTAGLDYDLTDTLKFSDKARIMDGKDSVDYFLNGQYVTGGADGFSAQAYANGLVKSVAGAASARYVIAGTNTVVQPTQDLALADNYVSARTTLSDFMNDARFETKIDHPTLGKHDLAVGLYYSHYEFSQQRLIGTFLSTINNNAQMLDVQALSPSGAVLGNVTENGFTSYGNGASGSVVGDALSVYASDAWHVTEDWQIDLGFREETEDDSGYQGVLTTQSLTVPNVIVPIKVSGVTSYTPKSETLHGNAWTVGSAYQIGKPANLFIRYTESYAFPRFQNVYAGANFNGTPLPVSKISQAESGLKLSFPGLSVFGVGFYSHFSPLIQSALVQNAANVLVNQTVLADTTDYGGELEVDWKPIRAFDLRADATVQKTSVNNVQAPGYSTADAEGKWIPRIPNQMIYIQPTYRFDFGPVAGRAFATWSYIGKRYQDYNNLSRIPAYQTVDAGATADYRNVTFGLHVLNLTNSTGLTEGNSRASAVALTPATPVADVTIGRPIYGRTFTVDATWHW